jgi:aryl-alcohol dehydrogenase-like predicted oxidoreductase
MTFGQQNTEKEGHQQLDFALDQGVNFIDTAELYSVPPMAETYGSTEKIIGTWDKLKTQRDKIILATKAMGPMTSGAYARQGAGGPRLSSESLREGLENSLRRLQVDYIDLYQLHWPERRVNSFGRRGYQHHPEDDGITLEETLSALKDFQKEGKVRHFGLSNETPWGVMECLRLHREKGLPRMMSIQNPYSLLNRLFEIGLAEVAQRENIGLLAYSPMGFGVLSGKYLKKKPKDGRVTLFPRFSRYSNPQAEEATKRYVRLAMDQGLNPGQMALAFVNQQPFVTSTIIGATTMDQLKENIGSVDIHLSEDLIKEINVVSESIPNPSP